VLWPQRGDKGIWRDGQWRVGVAPKGGLRNATNAINSASPCFDAPCLNAFWPRGATSRCVIPRCVIPRCAIPRCALGHGCAHGQEAMSWEWSPKNFTGSRCMSEPEPPLGHLDTSIAAIPSRSERLSTPRAWAAEHHFRTYHGAGILANWSPPFKSHHARFAGGQGITSTLEAGAWTTNRWQGRQLW
jgi:hypothetical protein